MEHIVGNLTESESQDFIHNSLAQIRAMLGVLLDRQAVVDAAAQGISKQAALEAIVQDITLIEQGIKGELDAHLAAAAKRANSPTE